MMKLFTLTLTEPELQALSGLVDAGLRASGLRAARDAAVLLDKMELAVSESNVPPVIDAPQANGHSGETAAAS